MHKHWIQPNLNNLLIHRGVWIWYFGAMKPMRHTHTHTHSHSQTALSILGLNNIRAAARDDNLLVCTHYSQCRLTRSTGTAYQEALLRNTEAVVLIYKWLASCLPRVQNIQKISSLWTLPLLLNSFREHFSLCCVSMRWWTFNKNPTAFFWLETVTIGGVLCQLALLALKICVYMELNKTDVFIVCTYWEMTRAIFNNSQQNMQRYHYHEKARKCCPFLIIFPYIRHTVFISLDEIWH